jgi:FMN phosphatase YigB (HAD superfamily)
MEHVPIKDDFSSFFCYYISYEGKCNMIRYLIYDLDDTLVSDLENKKGAFIYLLNYMKLPYSDLLFQKWNLFDQLYWKEEIYKKIAIPNSFKISKEIFTEYVRSARFCKFFHVSLDDAFLLNQVYQNGLFQKIVPFPNVYDTISSLSKTYPSYVATNGVSSVVKYKLEVIQISSFIQQIFAADMTTHTVTKAKEQFWYELIDAFLVHNPEEYLVVGDNMRDDILVPKKLGFQTCYFNRQNQKPCYGDYQIQDISELKKVLQQKKP